MSGGEAASLDLVVIGPYPDDLALELLIAHRLHRVSLGRSRSRAMFGCRVFRPPGDLGWPSWPSRCWWLLTMTMPAARRWAGNWSLGMGRTIRWCPAGHRRRRWPGWRARGRGRQGPADPDRSVDARDDGHRFPGAGQERGSDGAAGAADLLGRPVGRRAGPAGGRA